MKKSIKNMNTPLQDSMDENMISYEEQEVITPKKKKKLSGLRAGVVCLLVLTLVCGIIYPVSVTLMAQTLFPYEANGSQIVVTLKDGTQKIYGSELIGQQFESPEYLLGRVNAGAPSNLSPESEEYKTILQERVNERKEKLLAFNYTEGNIPSELITSSGSGVDPHISPETAIFQIPLIVLARNALAQTEEEKITEEEVLSLIEKYTEGRFLWIFGEKRVNVLLVNLALDGLI